MYYTQQYERNTRQTARHKRTRVTLWDVSLITKPICELSKSYHVVLGARRRSERAKLHKHVCSIREEGPNLSGTGLLRGREDDVVWGTYGWM